MGKLTQMSRFTVSSNKMNTEAEAKVDVSIKKKTGKNPVVEIEPLKDFEQSSNGHSAAPVSAENVDTSEAAVKEPLINGATNGKSKNQNTNGASQNGNSDVGDDDSEAPISEHDNDELFPELNYDEEEDTEGSCEVASPGYSPVSRSITRRSQAKKIPTPETPQPKQAEDPTSSTSRPPSRSTPQPESPMVREKVLRLREGATPRRDSNASDTSSSSKKNKDKDQAAKGDIDDNAEPKMTTIAEEVPTKTDTNFSKSRIKVSPYRRSMRLSEQYSTMANYSGNNTTQEVDITGDISSSSRDRSPALDSDNEQNSNGENRSYVENIRNIKGRRSYRPLREVTLRHLSVQKYKKNIPESEKDADEVSISSVNATIGSDSDSNSTEASSTKWTPVGHVVGRKRRQEDEVAPSPALILSEGPVAAEQVEQPPSKRIRLFGYVTTPFRHLREKVASSTPIFNRYSPSRTSYKVDPLTTSETVPNPSTEEPMVADIIHKPTEERKWCSIM